MDESESTAKTFPFGTLIDITLVIFPEPQPASRTISLPFHFLYPIVLCPQASITFEILF